MGSLPRTPDDVRADWNTREFARPGFIGDRRAPLQELVGMCKDADAIELINALADDNERGAYALALIVMLLREGNGARARNALLSSHNISRAVRFSACVAIFAACRLEDDLDALRTATEQMPLSEKPQAFFTVFGLTGDNNDLVQVCWAMATPPERPRHHGRRK